MIEEWKHYKIVIEFDSPSDGTAEDVEEAIVDIMMNRDALDDRALDINRISLVYDIKNGE